MKKVVGGTDTEEKYGQISVGDTQTMRRVYDTQPYLTFRLKLNNKERTTIATQKGQNTITLLLGVLSLIGGLYTSIGATASIAVSTLTKTHFITTVTKNLFLVKKMAEGQKEQVDMMDTER
jgi:hypothetical protein